MEKGQEEDRVNIWFQEAQHHKSPYTRAVMTQRDCESHKIDYARVEFESLDLLAWGYSSMGGPSGAY